MRHLRTWTMLALAGCAAPERVLLVEAVLGTTTTPTPTSTPTTPTPTTVIEQPDPSGPSLSALDVAEGELTLALTFRADPGDAALDGGTLLVTLDDDAYVLEFPRDLDAWSGGVGTVIFDRPTVGRCALAADHQLTVELLDTDGLSSGVVGAQKSTQPQGVVVDEVGDDYVTLLGDLGPGDRVCGALYGTGHSGSNYTSDRDMVGFQVDPAVRLSMSLSWDAAPADYDLYLFESDGGTLTPLDEAAVPGQGPEALQAPLDAGVQYVLLVVGWDGLADDWTIDLQ
ncbi:MAG: hypothetical protein R3F59_17670 [Myxococcota bacterium]